MKKMKTLFVIDRETDLATREVQPGYEWAFTDVCDISIKVDGTPVFFKNGVWYKRWDRKLIKKFAVKASNARRKGLPFSLEEGMFKPVPPGAIACEPSPDPVTFHHPHWVPIGKGPEDVVLWECINNLISIHVDNSTYEAIGPKIQGNMYNVLSHFIIKHGSMKCDSPDVSNCDIPDVSFDSVKQWLKDNEAEGLIFKNTLTGEMCKIRRKDFFDFKEKVNGKRKIDWRNDNVIFD
jgi:hypothetical protein